MSFLTTTNGSPLKDADAELTSADRAGAPPPSTSVPLGAPGDPLAAQRIERRDERAAARDARQSKRVTGKRPRRDTRSRTSPAERQGRRALRETVSVGLLAIIAGGALVGAILGAVGVPGWVVGLLVAGVTVILSAWLRRA